MKKLRNNLCFLLILSIIWVNLLFPAFANETEIGAGLAGASSGYTEDCITFSSPEGFTLEASEGKSWDGTLYYSVDRTNWNEWNGSEISAAQAGGIGEYCLYVRGDASNTKVSNEKKWVLTPAGTELISCTGNIETLRGAEGDAPSDTTMGKKCYMEMFKGCTCLVSAPSLSANVISEDCYNGMFRSCENLLEAPELPATEMKERCYQKMFDGCTGLTKTMALEATELATDCYMGMFWTCTSLLEVPDLPATELAPWCYQDMFSECYSLTIVKPLTATTMAEGCYQEMFKDCKGLIQVPQIEAETLAEKCFRRMFEGCSELVLRATASDAAKKEWTLTASGDPEQWKTNMFNDCPNVDLDGEGAKSPVVGVTYFTQDDPVIPDPPQPDPPAPEPEEKTSGSDGEWTAVPSTMGTADNPISEGSWGLTNGVFQYSTKDGIVRHALAWIRYTAADGKEYTERFYFDKYGKMQTGWQLIDGVWYYFEPAAGPLQGAMYRGRVTPDGYTVDENGRWINP